MKSRRKGGQSKKHEKDLERETGRDRETREEKASIYALFSKSLRLGEGVGVGVCLLVDRERGQQRNRIEARFWLSL